jgi:hypothetical protein
MEELVGGAKVKRDVARYAGFAEQDLACAREKYSLSRLQKILSADVTPALAISIGREEQ